MNSEQLKQAHSLYSQMKGLEKVVKALNNGDLRYVTVGTWDAYREVRVEGDPELAALLLSYATKKLESLNQDMEGM